MKKRRGAGNRGGRGNAGSGKRGDARKPLFQKIGRKWGRNGFKNPTTKKVSTITVKDLDLKAESLGTTEGKFIIIDLSKKGIDKVLATGKVTKPLKVTVNVIVSRAKEKIVAAGGQVIELQETKKEEVDSEQPTD
ncbi:50S ribosomal protein L15 [Candidatus Woesearchaeota archaeon]|nr:50S ribosomal protein L15 [Candidatus Woesearchaeota archaeon]